MLHTKMPHVWTLCYIQKCVMSEHMFHTNMRFVLVELMLELSKLMLHTKMWYVRTYDTHENVMSCVQTYVNMKMCNIQTYVTQIWDVFCWSVKNCIQQSRRLDFANINAYRRFDQNISYDSRWQICLTARALFAILRASLGLFQATPVAEWLKPLILGLKITRHLTAVGSSLARVTCDTSQVLLAGGQLFFLREFPFSLHLTTDSAQNEWNLDGL